MAGTTIDRPLLAGIELGGTKCVCTLGTGPDDIWDQVRLPTEGPAVTLAAIEQVLDRWRSEATKFEAIGVASFGPLNLDRRDASFGFITSTAKPGWPGTDLAGRFERRYALPLGFDTDVNGAAVAEGRWGAAGGLDDYAYVTVGTGVGVGLVVGGRPIGGFTHAELGHMRVQRLAGDDWPGSCAFHGDCVEGLASGSAIEARLGVRGGTLAPDHPVWTMVAHTLGQLLHTMVVTAAPRCILMGGGVMDAQRQLFPAIRRELVASLGGYIVAPELTSGIEDYVVPPALGGAAGPLGSLALAADALRARGSVVSMNDLNAAQKVGVSR